MEKLARGLVAVASVAAAVLVVPGTAEAAAAGMPWSAPQQRKLADFDGDGKTDIAVWRPSNGTWYIKESSSGQTRVVQYGQEGDTPVPADYDGDRHADLAVFRPSTAYWYIWLSGGGQVIRKHGEPGNTPIGADFDGDHKADLGIFTGQTWKILRSSDGQIPSIGWGQPGDVALAADYDGDGRTDLGVYRYDSYGWHYLRSSDGTSGNFQIQNGEPGYLVPLIGDLDGDHRNDLTTVTLNSDAYSLLHWRTVLSGGGMPELYGNDMLYSFTHSPFTGDFNGDGRDDLGYSVESDEGTPQDTWWRILTTGGGEISLNFGQTGDLPV